MNKRGFQAMKSRTLEALHKVGRCYETGDGVGKDDTEAVQWYRVAAELGDL